MTLARPNHHPLRGSARIALLGALSVGVVLGGAGVLLVLHLRGVELRPHPRAVANSWSGQTPPPRADAPSVGATAAPLAAAADSRLAAVRDLYFSDEKLAALSALAEQAAPAEIPALLDTAAKDPMLSGARVAFLKQLLARWARTDPTAALTWTRQNGTAAERTELATAVLREWAAREPRAAAEQAACEGSLSRAVLVHAVMETWGQTSPTEAQKWIEAMPPSPLQADVQSQFLRSLILTDPIAAADFATKNPRGGTLDQVVALWADRDAVAAVAWALDLPPGSAREAALSTLAGAWAQLDLAGATRYAGNFANPEQRSAFIYAAAESLAARDPKAALAWAQGLPDSADRDRAFNAAVTRWAEISPAAAARYLATAPPDFPTNEVATTVVMQWAAQDPAAVAEWMATLPDQALRTSAAETLASQWVVVDPPALESWWRRLPEGPMRDNVIAAAATRLNDSHPGIAADWAVGITDPAQRKHSLEVAISQWKNTDPDAARAWLTRTTLDPELKATLIADLGGKQ